MKKPLKIIIGTVFLAFALTITYLSLCVEKKKIDPDTDFNIVLITIDALRADHLSCYGYERNTTPNIDKIAEKGIIFKNAIATSSWTAPSMVSLFTSLYPINHGVLHGMGYKKDEMIHKQEVFSDELTTLAELLKEHGYTTIGVASNLHLSEKFGFARGFDYFACLPFEPAHSVNEVIGTWKRTINKSDKYFLWVHYIDPHYPYSPKKPWVTQYVSKESMSQIANLSDMSPWDLTVLHKKLKEDKGELSKLKMIALEEKLLAHYDSEINYVDSYIGELIQKFNLVKNALVIITSDHGEEFFEYDFVGHGNNLHHETTRIPLIIKLPHSSEKEIVEKNISLVDIMPTILHVLDIVPPEQNLGQPFLEKERIVGAGKKIVLRKSPSMYVYSELDNWNTLRAVITPKWKYIYDYKDDAEKLYDITSDPMELNDLAEIETTQLKHLKERLFNWVSHAKKYPTTKLSSKLSPEEKEKLKNLGYIQ